MWVARVVVTGARHGLGAEAERVVLERRRAIGQSERVVWTDVAHRGREHAGGLVPLVPGDRPAAALRGLLAVGINGVCGRAGRRSRACEPVVGAHGLLAGY